jgi:methionyl-tRNA synthetase
MVLCGQTADHSQVELLEPPAGAEVGERITFEGCEGFEPVTANQVGKKKVLDAVLPDFTTNDDCVGCWKGKPFMTSKGPCKVLTIKGGKVG